MSGYTACPVCGHVRPLHPGTDMTWCPCGWRDEDPFTVATVTFVRVVSLVHQQLSLEGVVE